MSLEDFRLTGGAEVRVCHTVVGPNGTPYRACWNTPAPWPGVLAAEHDPGDFVLTIVHGDKSLNPGPDLIHLAMIQYLAASLSDSEAATEIGKSADAALTRLNSGLPTGFGSLTATLLVPTPPGLMDEPHPAKGPGK